MRFYTSWFLVVMMFLSLCAASGVVLAVVTYDTTYVDDNGPLGGNHFQDIAAALAQTEAGGTIYIAAGTYVLSSPLAPNNDVTFVGEGADRVFIDASGVSRAFDVQDVSFGLYGCTVFGASTCVMIQWDDDARDYAASLQGNAIHSAREPDTGVSVILSGTYGEVDIIGNAIHDNFGFGISFYLSTNAELFSTILDNDIYDNTGTGISLVAAGSKVGMSIEKNTVYGNGTLTNNTGVYASFLHTDVEYLSIKGNAIHDNHGDGIHIVFTGTTEAPPTDGAVMVIAETLDISGNEIVRNVGNGIAIGLDFLPPAPEGQGTFPFDVAGILSEAVIADNRIDDNALTGILIDTDACFSPVSQEGTPQQVVSLLFDVYIEKNLVRGNGSGGIYCNAPFIFGIFNNLIAGNGGQAHGVSIRADSVSFWHNTVTGNSTGVFFGANFSFFNNIIASNNSYGIATLSGSPLDGNGMIGMFVHNDVWGNGCSGADNYYGFPDMTGLNGNISADPRFSGQYDAHLQVGSPCIDSGWKDGVYPFVQDDLEDTPRPLGMGFDMGCYEFRPNTWTPYVLFPPAMTQLGRANAFWDCIKEQLPEDITDPAHAEALALVEEIQAVMARAGSLTNPVTINGLMNEAQALMAQLDALLQCGCS